MNIAVALPPARGPNHIARAVVANVIGATRSQNPAEVAERLYPKDEKTLAVVTRAAATIGSTTVSGWASQLAQNHFRDFLVDLAPLSAASRLIAMGIPALIDTAQTILYPARSGAPAVLPWVAEGAPIPVTQKTLELVTIGPAKKFGIITAFTRELAKRSDATTAITQILKEDAAKSLDAAYFSTGAASGAVHPGLLNGVSPIEAYGGGDEQAFVTDIRALLTVIGTGGSGQAVLIVSHAKALTIPVQFPHHAASLTILGSSAVADDRVIAVDPGAILHATDPAPDIMAGLEAIVHMNDDPLEIVDDSGITADPTRSLYQTDGVSLRLLADIAFAKRRATAVVFIDGVTW